MTRPRAIITIIALVIVLAVGIRVGRDVERGL